MNETPRDPRNAGKPTQPPADWGAAAAQKLTGQADAFFAEREAEARETMEPADDSAESGLLPGPTDPQS